VQLCLMIEGQEGVTWPQWLGLAQACEEHAIPTLFRSDHYQNLDPDGRHPERGSLDAWGTLNALSAVTSTLRFGTMVSPATFRHPSVLAKLVATADHVSDGRIELGIGAGWHQREHDAYGFPFPSTAVRMDILEEQLQIVFGNWGVESFSFAGRHYTLRDLDAQPKPVQRPRPPVIMGGTGGPRSAALAARFADEYNTPFPTLEEIAERKGRISEACERVGRDPIPFSVMTGVVLGTDAADLRDRASQLGARNLLSRVRGDDDPEGFLANPPAGWIVGTIDQAVEQLTALREAGVSRVMCQQLLHDDLDAVALLGDEVARRLA
jgi:F420-dependent oxidoreductase-like protein